MIKARDVFRFGFARLEQLRRTEATQPYNFTDFIFNVDFFSGEPTDMRISLNLISEHHLQSVEADCSIVQARAQRIIHEFQSNRNSLIRLADIQLVWTSATRISILFELVLRGSDWELGRSVVRVQ
jgi:hypothetical protein